MKHIITAGLLLMSACTNVVMAHDYAAITSTTYKTGNAILDCVSSFGKKYENNKDVCSHEVDEMSVEKASSFIAQQATPLVGKVLPVAQGVYDCTKDPSLENCSKAAGQTAVTIGVSMAATPVAVASAGALGVTAGTGTAIASLSGAAATSATMAAVGSSAVVAPVTAALGIVAAPAVVGAVVVGGVAIGVGMAINWLFF